MSFENSWSGVRLFTIGHSTRTLDELLALLRASDISVLVDVRTVPRSRRNPQFNRDVLPSSCRARGVQYVHLAALGGLRHARKDSLNTAWRNASFRGYADYIQTDGFEEGLEALHQLAARHPVALMCAEAVPWRCHRSLIADVLTSRGAVVEHIVGEGRPRPHRLTPFAKVDRGRVTYPGSAADDGLLLTRAPFHLEATVRVLQRRPTNLVDRWEGDRYVRVLEPAPGALVLVEVENRGTIDAPDVHLSMRPDEKGAASHADATQIVRRLLGLDVDPTPLQQLAEAERKLRPTARALRGMRPPRFAGLFETFANVVPFQQVSLDAGVAVVRHLVERFGARVEDDSQLRYAFPTASAVAGARVATLRSCGLSARKAEALRAIARKIASGELTEDMLAAMSTADALEALQELPGIGPWSADLVLLRGFRRLDVFPSGDVGVQRGLGALLDLRSDAALRRVVERFGDHRGYLYFCSLGASLVERGLIHPADGNAPPAERPTPRSRATVA